MKKVMSFEVSQIRVANLIAFLEFVVKLLETSGDFRYKDYFLPRLKAGLARIIDVSGRHRGSLLTPEIKAADRNRDAVLTAFLALATMHTNDADPEKRAAAEIIMRIKKSAGNITAMPYNQQTGAMITFVHDLQAYHNDAVALLGLTEHLEAIAKANAEFQNLISRRDESKSGYSKDDLRQARRAAVEDYRWLTKDLELLSKEYAYNDEKQEELDTVINIIDMLNAEIQRQKFSLRVRKTEEEDEEIDDGEIDTGLDDETDGDATGSEEDETQEELEEETTEETQE